jgi:hypothetical protein
MCCQVEGEAESSKHEKFGVPKIASLCNWVRPVILMEA